MNISIFGMGYVGCVTAACLIKQGHNVIGVDKVDFKVDNLNNGIWPIYEPKLDGLNDLKILKNNFRVTKDEEKAISDSEISLICVGTPSTVTGTVELKYLQTVISNIRNFLINNKKNHVVLIRSTIPPGTTKKLVYSYFKELKEKVKIGFLPEFLREGNAIDDFFNPSLKIIGCDEGFPVKILDKIFPDVKGEWIKTEFEVAESLKYISNSWHALKIVFTNEVAAILKEYGTDSELAMDIFSRDKVLNISSKYMQPGFSYGGSCLPKDLAALTNFAKSVNINTPLLDTIPESNVEMINRLESLIYAQDLKNIGFCGISFKPNTDDIRNSPLVSVIKNLMNENRSYQKRYNISIYDQQNTLNNFSKDIGLDVNKITDENKISDAGDIIILGPHVISEGTIFTMLKNNKIIIDLKWHKLSEEIKSHTNYRSLL